MTSVAVVDLAHSRLIDRRSQINLKNFRMPVMFPSRDGIAGSKANTPRTDKRAVSRSSFDLSRNFGRTSEVINEHRMTDRGFGGAKWSFFEDRRVERSPSGVLAICDQPVAWTHGPAMSLIDSENACRRGVGEHWQPFYHIQFLFSKVNFLLAIDCCKSLLYGLSVL